jgi:hypothetical protein
MDADGRRWTPIKPEFAVEVIEGGLPRRAFALVLEWANEHRDELSVYSGTGH